MPSTYKERVAEAVNDDVWQEFRRGLKGLETPDKLEQLQLYYQLNVHLPTQFPGGTAACTCDNCSKIKLRIDNYLKALARGGQLYKGASLWAAMQAGGITKLPIRK